MNSMNFSKLKGQHAILGGSNYAWLNYDDEKFITTYMNKLAAERGTRLHAFAAEAIELGQKFPRSKKTLNAYVNDAIGFNMFAEEVLYYSPNFFGTADAIREDRGMLRIHDYKSGKIPAHMQQLYIYAALYCLEHGISPGDLEIETRIYQNDEVFIEHPKAEDIAPIMDKGVHFDKLINEMNEREG